jgi:hypothetical protein
MNHNACVQLDSFKKLRDILISSLGCATPEFRALTGCYNDRIVCQAEMQRSVKHDLKEPVAFAHDLCGQKKPSLREFLTGSDQRG